MLKALILMSATGLTAAKLMTMPQMAAAITFLAMAEAFILNLSEPSGWGANIAHFLILQTVGETSFFCGIGLRFWHSEV